MRCVGVAGVCGAAGVCGEQLGCMGVAGVCGAAAGVCGVAGLDHLYMCTIIDGLPFLYLL